MRRKASIDTLLWDLYWESMESCAQVVPTVAAGGSAALPCSMNECVAVLGCRCLSVSSSLSQCLQLVPSTGHPWSARVVTVSGVI